MILNEIEYRKTKLMHYSALKQFDNNRLTFYREYELGQKEQSAVTNYSMIMGSLIDCLLLEPDEFDSKFKVAYCSKPTGQMGEFIDTLYNITLKFIDKDNQITETLKNRLELAFDLFKKENPTKFKGKDLNYVIENFNKKDKDNISPLDYFQECLSSSGKLVIDNFLLNRAEKIVDTIKHGKYTKHLFQYDKNKEILYQKGIIFEYLGEICKTLHDRIEINHKTKTIESFDLKSTWDSEGFDYSFKKLGYYLQGGLYYSSLEQLKKDLKLEDYEILNRFTFIVCDTSMEFLPHLRIMDENLINSSLNGFEDKYGIKYKGVNQLISEIQFCRNMGDFKDSLELNNTNGKIKIEI